MIDHTDLPYFIPEWYTYIYIALPQNVTVRTWSVLCCDASPDRGMNE